MKRKFLLGVFSLLMSAAVFAQEGVKVGFRASPLISFANITDSNKTKVAGMDLNAKLGFSFDFVLTVGFNETVGFATGINIATKGYKGSMPLPLGTLTETLNFNQQFTSVEIPLGLKFRSPEIGTGIYIIGLFGVAAEVNVATKGINDIFNGIDSTGINITRDVETRDTDVINLFTTSFTPGVGVDWQFDWGMIEMAMTYHWGLLNILKKDENNNMNGKLNYIALNLGYFF